MRNDYENNSFRLCKINYPDLIKNLMITFLYQSLNIFYLFSKTNYLQLFMNVCACAR